MRKTGQTAMARRGCEAIIVVFEGLARIDLIRSHFTKIDTVAFALSLFFDLCEKWKLVRGRLGLIEPGDSIDSGALGISAGDDGDGHADDRRGIHAAGEFGEDRTVGAE